MVQTEDQLKQITKTTMNPSPEITVMRNSKTAGGRR